MINTVNMFIYSIVKWKVGYNVIHVTNSFNKGYTNWVSVTEKLG